MSYICPKCGLEKDRVNPPSRGNLCVDCVHYRDHLYYEKAKIKGTVYKRIKKQKQYETSEQLKERRKNNKEKYIAHTAVGNALRDGRIIKKECRKCGELKTEAHHPDYSKPLEVIWLCPKHHKQLHTKPSKYMNYEENNEVRMQMEISRQKEEGIQDAEIVERLIIGTTPIMKEWREIEKLWL